MAGKKGQGNTRVFTPKEIADKIAMEAKGLVWVPGIPEGELASTSTDHKGRMSNKQRADQGSVNQLKRGRLTLAEKRFNVEKVMDSHGITPIDELCGSYLERYPATHERAGQFVMEPKERIALMKDLLKYTAPTLKSVDVKNTGSGGVTINIVNFSQQDVMPDESDIVDVTPKQEELNHASG